MREKGGVEKNEKWKLEMKLEKLKKEKKTMKKVSYEQKKNKGKKKELVHTSDLGIKWIQLYNQGGNKIERKLHVIEKEEENCMNKRKTNKE